MCVKVGIGNVCVCVCVCVCVWECVWVSEWKIYDYFREVISVLFYFWTTTGLCPALGVFGWQPLPKLCKRLTHNNTHAHTTTKPSLIRSTLPLLHPHQHIGYLQRCASSAHVCFTQRWGTREQCSWSYMYMFLYICFTLRPLSTHLLCQICWVCFLCMIYMTHSLLMYCGWLVFLLGLIGRTLHRKADGRLYKQRTPMLWWINITRCWPRISHASCHQAECGKHRFQDHLIAVWCNEVRIIMCVCVSACTRPILGRRDIQIGTRLRRGD